jgi:HPt (histidine-containing phosphotransfer) domain-containing protein
MPLRVNNKSMRLQTTYQDDSDWQSMQQHFRAQPELFGRLLVLLTKTLADIRQELDAARQAQNLDDLAKIAHNIKGTALNLRTPQLAELAVQTQDQARRACRQSLESADTLSARLQRLVDLARLHQQT